VGVALAPAVVWVFDQSRATIAAGRPVCGMSPPGEPSLLAGGYVVVDSPDAARPRPALRRSCNSREAGNHVVRRGAGHYDVRLGKLGVDGGTVEVTAISDEPRICGAEGWGIAGNGTDLVAQVACADGSGAARDSGFVLNFRQAQPGTGDLAYLRYDDQPGKLSIPEPNYSFNSAGSAVSVERRGTGEYAVYLQDMQRSLERKMPGVAKVTSLGPVPRACNPGAGSAWTSPRSHKSFLVLKVRCTDAAGVATDTRFTVTYVVRLASRPGERTAGAQLRADQAHARRYTPTSRYQYNSTGSSMTIERAGPGRYAVELTGFDGEDGMAQVSAFDGDASCAVAHSAGRLHDTTTVGVRCWQNGRPADAEFVLLHQP